MVESKVLHKHAGHTAVKAYKAYLAGIVSLKVLLSVAMNTAPHECTTFPQVSSLWQPQMQAAHVCQMLGVPYQKSNQELFTLAVPTNT
jgi:hypothetical protein